MESDLVAPDQSVARQPEADPQEVGNWAGAGSRFLRHEDPRFVGDAADRKVSQTMTQLGEKPRDIWWIARRHEHGSSLVDDSIVVVVVMRLARKREMLDQMGDPGGNQRFISPPDSKDQPGTVRDWQVAPEDRDPVDFRC
jgi:hypothetical protein